MSQLLIIIKDICIWKINSTEKNDGDRLELKTCLVKNENLNHG